MTTPPPRPVSAPRNPARTDPMPNASVNSIVFMKRRGEIIPYRVRGLGIRTIRRRAAALPARPADGNGRIRHVKVRSRYTDQLVKRSERHRLKENELTHALSEAGVRLAEQQRTFGVAAALVLAVALAALGYWAWHTRTETRAQVMLTEALTIIQSPVEVPKPDSSGKITQAAGTYPTVTARAEAALAKFTAVADSYPSTNAGIAARYYAAAALATLGRAQEAATRYQEVIDKAGTKNFYGRMAQLGVVEALVQAKQYD